MELKRITGIKPEFEKIDLKEKRDVARFFNRHADLDGIIHFAASKAVGESVNNPLKYYENNIYSLVNTFLKNSNNWLLQNLFSVPLVRYMGKLTSSRLLKIHLSKRLNRHMATQK